MLKSIKRTSRHLISSTLLATAMLGAFSKSFEVFAAEPVTLRTLDSHSPFVPPTDIKLWEQRADEVRLQLKVSLGIWPAPELDPVRPNIYGKIDRDDYTIEKVTFESLPGYFVTGNLYRPKNAPADKPMPGILCPPWSLGQCSLLRSSCPRSKAIVGNRCGALRNGGT